MPNGSLDAHLFTRAPNNKPLSWDQRYNIISGVASALHYLHNEYDQRVVHRDLKASNIMLDSDFNARLGDFGLARALDKEKTSYTEAGGVAGTLGYIAPECFLTGKATQQSDVYAFGVVLLEIVCGLRPGTMIEEFVFLVDWVWSLHREGRILDAVEERLGDEYVIEEAQKMLILALACCQPIASERPRTQGIVQIISGLAPVPYVPPFKPAFVWPMPSVDDNDISSSTSLTETRVVKNNLGADEAKRKSNIPNTPVLDNQNNRFVNETGNGSQLSIKVSEVGNEWLSRSAIAKLYRLRSMEYMQDHLKNLDYSDIQVRPIDGNRVVLTFPNIEDRDSVFNGAEIQTVVQNLNVNNENAEQENKVAIVEEVVVTNDKVERVEGIDARVLQHVKVGMQGCNDEAAARDMQMQTSSSGIESSARGSGMVRGNVGNRGANITLQNIDFTPLTIIRLNKSLQVPRACLSNLVDNHDSFDSWVANSVNEISASTANPREINEKEEPLIEDEPCHAPIKVAINSVKGKRKRKTIYDILGYARVNSSNNKGRKNKQKNRIILNEAQAVWTCNKILGMGCDGDEDEVVSKIAEMEAQNLDKANRVAGQP
ncbi:hypothetical protein RHGRI_022547 [Rhododendron griersonianum]|uniref:Protein kinase domain-containing protein n=1 Tax=Rhododendron griersonianum TaxID=479676 RepID=A0AAV6J3E6_9ERIC|nr:hypothetical protein RHGRI_022547 [Rhododendron griersonianum]